MVKEKYPIEARERLKDKESVTHKVFNGQKKKEKKTWNWNSSRRRRRRKAWNEDLKWLINCLKKWLV